MLVSAALSWALLMHLARAASVSSIPSLPPEPHEEGSSPRKPPRSRHSKKLTEEKAACCAEHPASETSELDDSSSSQNSFFGHFEGFFEEEEEEEDDHFSLYNPTELLRTTSIPLWEGLARPESNSLLNEMLEDSFLKDVGLGASNWMRSSTPMSSASPLFSSPRPFYSSIHLDDSFDSPNRLETIPEPEAEETTQTVSTASDCAAATKVFDKVEGAVCLLLVIFSYLTPELSELRTVNRFWHMSTSLALQLFAGESQIAVPISQYSALPMPFIVLCKSWLPLFKSCKMSQIRRIIDNMPELGHLAKDQDALVEERSELVRSISATLPVKFEKIVVLSKWKHVFSDDSLRFMVRELMKEPTNPNNRTVLLLLSEAMVLGQRTDLMFECEGSFIEAMHKTALSSEANPNPGADEPGQVASADFLEEPVPGAWKVPGVVLHLALQSRLPRLIYFLAKNDPSSIHATNALGRNAIQVAFDLYIARVQAQSQGPAASQSPVLSEPQLQEPFELISLQKAIPNLANLDVHLAEAINSVFTSAFKAKNDNILAAILQSLEFAELVDFEAKSNLGQNILHQAADDGNPQIWALLAAFPFSKSAANAHSTGGETPLTLAVNKGHEDIVQMMVKDSRFNVNATDKKGRTPLHCAVNTWNLECLRLLLEVPEVDMNARAGKNESKLTTPLERALKSKWEKGWPLFYHYYFPDDRDWQSYEMGYLKSKLGQFL